MERYLDAPYVIRNFTGRDNVRKNIDQPEANTTQQSVYANMQKRTMKTMTINLNVMAKKKMKSVFFNHNTMKMNGKDWLAKP